MYARNLAKALIATLFAAALAHCSSPQDPTEGAEGAERSGRRSPCPRPGARVPYAQLLAQTERFVGCDVETEVAFVGVGMGGVVGNSVAREGQSIFRTLPPGQSPSSGPLSADFSFLTVPEALAGPLFEMAAGLRFLVRGRMETQRYGGHDFGNVGRILRATRVAASP